jgi:hypothetical protein
VRELEDDRPYRVAELEPLHEIVALDIDLERERAGMLELFTSGSLAALPVGRQFRELLAGPLATADIADLVAFNFLEDVGIKQELLGQVNVRRRVAQTLSALQHYAAHFNPAMRGFPVEPEAN